LLYFYKYSGGQITVNLRTGHVIHMGEIKKTSVRKCKWSNRSIDRSYG